MVYTNPIEPHPGITEIRPKFAIPGAVLAVFGGPAEFCAVVVICGFEGLALLLLVSAGRGVLMGSVAGRLTS